MESDGATSQEQEMTPSMEIKKCKQEKFDFYDWEECSQRLRNNTVGSYFPVSYTSPSAYSSALTQTTLYSVARHETQAKPRMSFSISSILGTQDGEEERFHPASAHSPKYGMLMRHKTSVFRDSLKNTRMKRHFEEEETTTGYEEKNLDKGRQDLQCFDEYYTERV